MRKPYFLSISHFSLNARYIQTIQPSSPFLNVLLNLQQEIVTTDLYGFDPKGGPDGKGLIYKKTIQINESLAKAFSKIVQFE